MTDDFDMGGALVVDDGVPDFCSCIWTHTVVGRFHIGWVGFSKGRECPAYPHARRFRSEIVADNGHAETPGSSAENGRSTDV